MSKEFGIYPNMSNPKYWIGCRGILELSKRTKHMKLDIPWDRWSSEFGKDNDKKQALISWVNNHALKIVEKEACSSYAEKGKFSSEDGKYMCEYDKKNSGGYLYIGFWLLDEEAE